jgi:hypothetical protein
MFLDYFYNTQKLHKLLIKKSYDDYKYEIKKFNKKHPNFKANITGLDEPSKKEFTENLWIVEKKQKILINNLLQYSKNYPNNKNKSKICLNQLIMECKEYSYCLEENLDEMIVEL